MRRLCSFSASLCLAALVLALPGALSAQAQNGVARAPNASPVAPVRQANPAYDQALDAGFRSALARDWDSALASLRSAVQIDPSDPRALQLIAEVHVIKQDYVSAIDAFRAVARVAAVAADLRAQARALQGIAQALERIVARREEAREAWREYARFAAQRPDVALAEVARARIQAIDRVIEQERVSVEVKARIDARAREMGDRPTAASQR